MTPEERFAAIERNLQMITQLHLDAERKAEEWRQHWEQRAVKDEEGRDEWRQRAAEAEERHDREMEAIRAELRRATRLSIQEAQAERRKRRELDEKITQLAAAQLITEEKLQRLIEHRSSNGKPG
jgi:hypothetical protein